ncbi:ATP-binding protein [Leptolyngbya boryana CZ1]|uniref:ATP-binding protein n=1 Tax=Leptolyngbya boryana CZ1 TaxID=3060204 RepID=A0AA97AQ20_LEPBY|nr:ATP-binding protein [Leptolyngbya boryana]WNZ45309.1 ATP-binding protein [Leptolyngbya boryana CZ1]
MLTGWQHLEQKATQEQWSYAQFLLALCELETEKRSQTRIARAISEAQLPAAKSFSNFEFGHCSKLNPATLKQLAEDPGWVERAENLLLFGASGVGKPQPTQYPN